MPPCRWSKGCAQTGLGEDYCTYHQKILKGLISTTRVDSNRDIRSIQLPERLAEEARRERERNLTEALRLEAERRVAGWHPVA